MIIATTGSFQLMSSQRCCSNIWLKTPVISDVAPQRADSTSYRSSVLSHSANVPSYALYSPPQCRFMNRRWVPHYPPSSYRLLFYRKGGSLSICTKFQPNFARAKHHRGEYRPAVHSRCSMFLRLRLRHITRLISLILRRFLLPNFVPN